ncbi:UNVERIFIED_ORG: hypothetical protein J2W16_004066 [Pseudomonas cremoricolorata]|nr:hypothetical protein [Pseudomonas cremoricolorata]
MTDKNATDKKSHQSETRSGENKTSQNSGAEGAKGGNTERASKAELYSRHDKDADQNAKNSPKKP